MAFQVKEIFRTLQGEGVHVGTPSIFVRFVGCNLWSGKEEDRTRDVKRSGARCPSFCDTDFVGGERKTLEEVKESILNLSHQGAGSVRHIVFTGGEPALQLNRHPALLQELRENGTFCFALETNGTVQLKKELEEELEWVCVSPKVPADKLELKAGNELKVVFPAYDPLEYQILEEGFDHLLVQPEAPSTPGSIVGRDVVARAVDFCLKNPKWRLSTQQHKSLGIP